MREAPERFVKNRCRIRVAVGPRLLERADGAATTTSTAGSYEISGVPQMMRSARSQVRSPAMNGTSSAIHSYRFVALCGPPGVPTRARLRRSVSSSSDCTHIRVSISSAASRRPAPTPSTISNGHPAGTGIDPSRPCSAHCGGRKVTVPPWCTGIRIGTFCLVELARLELATPCLQTTGSTSTASIPAGHRPGTSTWVRSDPGLLRYFRAVLTTVARGRPDAVRYSAALPGEAPPGSRCEPN